MFLFEKYRPKIMQDLLYNKEILKQLVHISTNENIPHIIISGPPGGGKKTLVKFFLEALFDDDVNVLNKIKYNINGSSAKKEIEIMQSNYHIVIEPTNTNHDKYILQEIIKQYAMHKQFKIYKTERKFKIIVICNIENLSTNSQAALRRTMEIYARTCRFVMICNNLSKIFDPLRSRCRTFCVPLPSRNDICRVISYISIMENIKLSKAENEFIINNSGNNLKKAIWLLDAKRFKCDNVIPLDEALLQVVELILNVTKMDNVVNAFDKEIRTNAYNILITNTKGSDIIIILMDELIRRVNDDELGAKIIQFASVAEDNLIHGRRDITHIDFFVCNVMRELYKKKLLDDAKNGTVNKKKALK